MVWKSSNRPPWAHCAVFPQLRISDTMLGAYLSHGGKICITEISEYYKPGLFIFANQLLNICHHTIGYILTCMYEYTHYQSLRMGVLKFLIKITHISISSWKFCQFSHALGIAKSNHLKLRIVTSYCRGACCNMIGWPVKECPWSGKLRKFLLWERKVYRTEQRLLKDACSPQTGGEEGFVGAVLTE